jgi:hypothetical protein
MTQYEARQKGFSSGWILRLDQSQGLQIYLADYRHDEWLTTPYPSGAEYFRREIDATEMARRIRHLTGQHWIPTATGPAQQTPSDDDLTDAEYAMALQAAVDAFVLRDDDDECGEAIRTAWGSVQPQWGGGRNARRN